ncbi:MAG TPA: response regulator [Bacteroidota bacterium]
MDQEKLSILLVDDEETFVKMLAFHLRDHYGYKTTVAFSGKEAVQLFENSHTGFDVVLLDYMMPEMSGLNVLQWMLEQKNQTPVIMLTAAGSEHVAVEALKLGAYDYVRKELIDIPHLDILIRGTHERHLYRVSEIMEQEKLMEMAQNNDATERVRRIVNAVTPKLNSALAQLAVSVEFDPKTLVDRLPDNEREDFKKLLGDIQRNVQTLETATRGLLILFELLYAHHSGIPEIENIKHWFETKLQVPQA